MALAAMLIVGLAVAGCGGSSDSSSSTTSAATLSKAQFLSQANAICAKGNKELNAAGAKLGKNSSQADFTRYVTGTAIPGIQSQIDGITALGAPSGDQATVTSMLNLAQQDLDKIKANPDLLAGNVDQFANFAKVAHPYGLTACAPN